MCALSRENTGASGAMVATKACSTLTSSSPPLTKPFARKVGARRGPSPRAGGAHSKPNRGPVRQRARGVVCVLAPAALRGNKSAVGRGENIQSIMHDTIRPLAMAGGLTPMETHW